MFELKGDNMNDKEVWVDLKNYEGLYQISDFGNIKSLTKPHGHSIRKESIIKQYKTRKGYYKVLFSKDNKQKNFEVHRLVAENFLNKNDYKNMPEENRKIVNLEKLQVNHKDENKLNNKASNLEWCTNKYNVNYGKRGKKASQKLKKKILQYDKNGILLKEWQSIKEAQEELKISKINVNCLGKRKTSGGYIWKYKESN